MRTYKRFPDFDVDTYYCHNTFGDINNERTGEGEWIIQFETNVRRQYKDKWYLIPHRGSFIISRNKEEEFQIDKLKFIKLHLAQAYNSLIFMKMEAVEDPKCQYIFPDPLQCSNEELLLKP